VLGIVVLALLALPLLSVKGDAEAAKADLTAALDALESGDLPTAREHVTSARGHADSANEDMSGASAGVWSSLPVAGTAVDDVRHLVSALDDAVSVAEIGVDLYPSVAGKRATLFRDERLDLASLAALTGKVREAGGHLEDAAESLDQIAGTSPVVGDTIAANRDLADAEVSPMAETYAELEPMLDDLPALFGAEGKRTYLVAMLNPAELRYSGGATLAFAPMTWDNGTLKLGESLDLGATPGLSVPIEWPKVRGNTFHYPGPNILRNATLAPSWAVAGEELLRAWQSATGRRYDGVLAIDVVTLSRLFGIAGGVTVPGYGELTEANLVQTLVGSYDDYYPDPSGQDALNAAIIPSSKDQLFDGGDYVAKAKVLAGAADGRHLAAYFRDDGLQEGFTALGLEGDIAEPTGDYLGVFTQNTNGSKVDIHQRRSVSLDVALATDGSADHQLDVVVDNDTPPYILPVPDPREGYFTKWAGLALTTFVPDGAEVSQATFRGRPWNGYVGNYRDHDFLLQKVLLEPGSTAQFEASYTVPSAAEVSDDGDLTYRLAVDPQGTVIPQSVQFTIRLPRGYRTTAVPEGWAADGASLSFSSDAFDASQEWEFVAEAGS